MSNKNLRALRRAALLAGCFGTAATIPALAQNEGLETVTVTARYTQENLQTTPLAVTAVSGDQLAQSSVTNIDSLGAVVPNLFTHPPDNDAGSAPTIQMRGVSGGGASFATEPGVGVYIDDVYRPNTLGNNLEMIDIDHIEVARGPQGTLHGGASISGTISLYSKVPQGDDTGFFALTYGSLNYVEGKGSFDAKITDNLFLRVLGDFRKQDGFVDQLDFTCEMALKGTPALSGSWPSEDGTVNSAVPASRASIGVYTDLFGNERGCKIGAFGGGALSNEKLMLRYVANSRLEINFTASYYDDNDEAAPETLLAVTPRWSAAGGVNDNNSSIVYADIVAAYGVPFDTRFLPPAGQPYASYATFCRPEVVPNGGFCWPNKSGVFTGDTSLKLDYDVTDKMHLKVITAYTHNGSLETSTVDETPLGFVRDLIDYNSMDATGEVRLNGTSFGDKLDWVGGLFYLTATDHLFGDIISDLSSDFREDDIFQQMNGSAFAHAEYKLTDRLSISAGLRYTLGKKKAILNHVPLFPTAILPFTVKESHWDWLASASYQLTDDIMAYGTIATGSRPPAITTVVFSVNQLQTIPNEELTSYEAGFKTEWFNHRLRVNADGFYMDYAKRLTGITGYECTGAPLPHQPVPLAADCAISSFNPNYNPAVPATYGFLNWSLQTTVPAVVTGAEFEATAEPIDDLLINWNWGYQHLHSLVTTLGQPGYIYPGNINQPQWNSSAGVQYKFDTLGGVLTPRVDWVYQSDYTFNPSF